VLFKHRAHAGRPQGDCLGAFFGMNCGDDDSVHGMYFLPLPHYTRIMRENGTVQRTQDGWAYVKVTRLQNQGCGCGSIPVQADDLVRVPNTCGAKPGDKVFLEIDEASRKWRSTLRTALAFTALIAGMAAGNFLFGALLKTQSAVIPCAVALGAVFSAAVVVCINSVYKKKPLPEPKIMDAAPVHGFTAKAKKE